MLITLTMGGQLRAQVHTAPSPRQATDSECVGTLKAYKVRTRGERAVKTDIIRLILAVFDLQDIKNVR